MRPIIQTQASLALGFKQWNEYYFVTFIEAQDKFVLETVLTVVDKIKDKSQCDMCLAFFLLSLHELSRFCTQIIGVTLATDV